jgi:hypothetical protein
MRRRRVKRERNDWRNCNRKVWKNGEKKIQKGRRIVERRVTVR